MTEIGPHLLGRHPSAQDSRDYRLANFIGLGRSAGRISGPLSSVDVVAEIDAGRAELALTTIAFPRWAAKRYVDVTQTHWWKALDHFQRARNALSPPPVPTGIEWENPEPILDQGNTGHCVGFSGAQWGNTLPINDRYRDEDGHDIYYECKIVDGEPQAENGSYIRSLAAVLQNRERLSVYAFAANIDDVISWLVSNGPVVFGTAWYDDMFYPDSRGLIKASGEMAGGHAYVCNGYDPVMKELLFINSWGDWGNLGHFRISREDCDYLFDDWAEAMVSVELPL